MNNIINNKKIYKENWMQKLTEVVTDSNKLLELLNLKNNQVLNKIINNDKTFPLYVPLHFLNKIKKGDPLDPLLLQILSVKNELKTKINFSIDPNMEHFNKIPGLLHKYYNRVLLIVKGRCALNCRYCFRKNFPYKNNKGNKKNWLFAINYIKKHIMLDEVILSGGDPLIAKDHEIYWIIKKIEKITHIKRLRIHTRFPIVIPERITDNLCKILSNSRLQIIFVTHINHANEIDEEFAFAMKKLKQSNIILLNQSVLLKRINDNTNTLLNLSNSLFDVGILPYYLHVLDKVQGTYHFLVTDAKAKRLIRELLTKLSGYLVPKLVKEKAGKLSKILLDINLN
ncbi:EF-P beta-lysylation protein EpmB [Candidatus Providencia siddallii]|uniref:L-lysine 2,3-aminomutase n=1 Tax=Candidatus Providencia siddallii TaxID=1715285 RepID=A0ABM9NP56_9GAMM